MRGQVSAPSSLPRGERGCSSLFPSMAIGFVRAGRTGLRPAGTSGRTVRSCPALDGRGPTGPDVRSGPGPAGRVRRPVVPYRKHQS